MAIKSHQNRPSILPIISKFCHLLDENELDALGDEWDELPNVLKIHCTEDVTSMTPPQFWNYVRKLKNGIEEPRFPHLGPFFFKLMSLPHSTAAVERVFSSVNSVKTSKRNKMNSQTLKGQLLAKQRVSRCSGGCTMWQPSKRLVEDMVNGGPRKRYKSYCEES